MRFSIAAVLTVTTGVMLCNVASLYDLLNFMTNGSLFTHQLPRAAAWAKPYLIVKFPFLAEVVLPPFNGTDGQRAAQVEAFLTSLAVKDLEVEAPTDKYDHECPIASAHAMKRQGG